jgi:hypothetical protein
VATSISGAVAAVADPEREQQLAEEARRRVPAGAAAVAAGLLTLCGDVWTGIAFRDIPRAGFLESLGQAAEPGPIGRLETVRLAAYQYYEDHAGAIVGSAVLRALGLLGLAWAVTFLALATRARRPEFPRIGVYVTLVGGVLSALGFVLGTTGSATAISNFLDGPHTVDAASDVGSDNSLLAASQIVEPFGRLTLAAGLFLVSLNAMRTGLLTRFLGILGLVTGFLVVFPLGSVSDDAYYATAVVQAFWLVAIGLLMLGRLPGDEPPAWHTGRAEPWPSQRDVAEARRKRAQPPPEPEPEPVPAGRPHPSSKKRKRKRRG